MTADIPALSYDLIICVGVMAYIHKRGPCVQKLAAALKPGGTLIIECTDGNHFITRMDQAYEALRTKVGGKAFPTVIQGSSELLSMLEQFGFQVNGAFRYSLPLPGLGRFLSQKLSYAMIRAIYGTSTRNRAPWLGNECLFRLRRK